MLVFRLGLLIAGLALTPAGAALAQESGQGGAAQASRTEQQEDPAGETVLVRHVRIIDREGQSEDRVVNLLIKDGRLELVTEDEIPLDEADLALDGERGVVLGELVLRQPASFLLLDGDPRDDVQILLDTATHVRFAIAEGRILRNELATPAPDGQEEEQAKRSGWLSYNPPPISLPVGYRDASRWNQWETKYFSGAFIAVIGLDRHWWVEQDAASEEQVGDLEPFDRGDIRGLRFGAIGTLNFERPWVYTFFAATSSFDQGFDANEDDSLILYDYRLDIPLGVEGTLSIGKQKEPFSMDRIMGMLFDPMQERAAISDGMMPTRNVGVVYNSTLAGDRITYAGGVFNDWFDAGEEFDESATQIIGRITGLPFMSGDEASLIHLGFGLRYSNAKAGVRYRVPPEFHFSPDFVDTSTGMEDGSFEADSTMTYDFELSARRGPFWIHSEFLGNFVAAPAVGDPVFGGYHVTGSWVLTGEMRGYNKRSGIFDRIHVARPVTGGGSGAWELGARWSSFDLNDGAIEGGDMQILSFGATWWATDVANASVNFRNVNLDRFGLRGNSKGVTARVMLFLQ